MRIFNNRPLRCVTLLLTAVMACLAVTSCSDDYYNHPLVGNWQIVAPTNVDYNCYYFYPDGTGQYYVEDFFGQDYYNFAWEAEGPNLYIYFRNGDVWSFGWTIQGYSLYLYADGSPIPYVYNNF